MKPNPARDAVDRMFPDIKDDNGPIVTQEDAPRAAGLPARSWRDTARACVIIGLVGVVPPILLSLVLDLSPDRAVALYVILVSVAAIAYKLGKDTGSDRQEYEQALGLARRSDWHAIRRAAIALHKADVIASLREAGVIVDAYSKWDYLAKLEDLAVHDPVQARRIVGLPHPTKMSTP